MSNTTNNNKTTGKISNFKLFSFLVKKRKKTTPSNVSDDSQTSSPRSSNSDMLESPTNQRGDTKLTTTSSSPEYVDVTKTSLGALSENSRSNPRNSARIIRRADNEGFKSKLNNRKSAAFTKQQIVF